MNLPAAVITAMALCNQHSIANRGSGILWANGTATFSTCSSYSGPLGCEKETDAQRKEREDAATAYRFSDIYAWESSYQDKCKTIQDYVAKFQASLDKKAADKKAAEDVTAKAAEQPTLDKGIAALPAIKSLQQP
jgi:hypothetical protein